ncbi:MAG: divalent-cation tolerance protein CutA [Elusimicrobiota bacterium]
MINIVCFVTVPGKTKARQIARKLVQLRLCACVNLIGAIESHFFWKGKVDKAKETLLIIKTRRSKFAELERSLRRLHPYAVPEIIAVGIVAGHEPYLKWIRDTVR